MRSSPPSVALLLEVVVLVAPVVPVPAPASLLLLPPSVELRRTQDKPRALLKQFQLDHQEEMARAEYLLAVS